MIEALSMGEYSFFVWSSFLISMFVLLINYLCAVSYTHLTLPTTPYV